MKNLEQVENGPQYHNHHHGCINGDTLNNDKDCHQL